MTWTPAETLALARESCRRCGGFGLYPVHHPASQEQHRYKLETRSKPKGMRQTDWETAPHKQTPCPCVFRTVFRECLERFAECQILAEQGSFEAVDYQQDFLSLARKRLTKEAFRVFRFYFLLGADARLCARYWGLSREQVYRAAYRIEAILGRAYAEAEPHRLFPTALYFSTRKAT